MPGGRFRSTGAGLGHEGQAGDRATRAVDSSEYDNSWGAYGIRTCGVLEGPLDDAALPARLTGDSRVYAGMRAVARLGESARMQENG